MNQIKQDLIAARAVIADPANWTQNSLAKDAEGNDHPPSHPLANNIHWEGLEGNDPMACRWCALGAVQKATDCTGGDERYEAASSALDGASYSLFGRPLHYVNDNECLDLDDPHAAVLQVFDHAIGAPR